MGVSQRYNLRVWSLPDLSPSIPGPAVGSWPHREGRVGTSPGGTAGRAPPAPTADPTLRTRGVQPPSPSSHRCLQLLTRARHRSALCSPSSGRLCLVSGRAHEDISTGRAAITSLTACTVSPRCPRTAPSGAGGSEPCGQRGDTAPAPNIYGESNA